MIVSVLPIQTYPVTAPFVSLMSVGIIYILAPVEHENKPICQDQQTMLKIKIRIVVSVMSFIVIIGMMMNANSILLAIALSMTFVAGSMTYATLINKERCK